MMTYGFTTTVASDFETAVAQVIEALKTEGFGIMTEIDVQATMKKKLDIDKRPYKILGACHPLLANRAIEAEPDIGLLLPCNVIVREDESGKVVVGFMDPMTVLGLVEGSAAVASLGAEVKAKMERVCQQLS
ncbi:DUF302 domain-containing protein [Ectothiorhodospiraceae bacterium BW-2]|nr:DUF302 domain-containing protein [Ectothiorhodospiraceae bacterium BW-2]